MCVQTITPILPYPQNGFFCNVTGDNGIPQEGPFPLTVRVPVGVQVTVVFANITGPIPGTACSAVTQPGHHLLPYSCWNLFILQEWSNSGISRIVLYLA